jgi:glycerol-3-phosphate dehydrogenase
MASVALSPGARVDALAAMGSGELDVLVVGGGVVGAGCALDAATRGLSVGLVEARDLAAGTSSRSSKLIHGGLRYLEMLDFRLVAEALRERGLLLTRLAPHLVRPVPFLYPLTHRVWERAYVGTGVALYDTLAPLTGQARGLPHHRHLTRRGARRLAPSLRKDALVGALQYHDAQVDDARFTLFLARTAAAYGAWVATRARVVGMLREGGRVSGVEVHDLETGRTIRARARVVINATGVWTDDTQRLVGERGRFQVRPSKGVHLVVPRDRINSETGLILRTEKSVLFVIPWQRHWIIGTTDTDWALHKAHPAASASDIDYLLGHVNGMLTEPLGRDDVEGVYAGLRPLLWGRSESTSKLGREHAVATPVPGLVVVAGGKFTTYRTMASDAVTTAGHELGAPAPPSCTEDVPLLGADGFPALRNRSAALAAAAGLHPARIERLLGRYGSLVDEVLDLVAADPSLAAPLAGAPDYLRAEIAYAGSHEGARHLDDVLTRRTRISIETFDRGLHSCEEAAALLGAALGWSDAQREREIEHYRARVAAERESQRMPDDATADAARMGAPDVVPVA